MAAQPKLSDLYDRRQIARKWYRSLRGLAILNAIIGSQFYVSKAAWSDPVCWLQLIVTAAVGLFLVDKAVTTEDHRDLDREMAAISTGEVRKIFGKPEPKP